MDNEIQEFNKNKLILSVSFVLCKSNVQPSLIPVSYTHLDVYKRQVWVYLCAYTE